MVVTARLRVTAAARVAASRNYTLLEAIASDVWTHVQSTDDYQVEVLVSGAGLFVCLIWFVRLHVC